MNNLMVFLSDYYYAGPDAFKVLEWQLEILEGAFGRDHPKVGDQLRALGDLYLRKGELSKAEELYLRSLTIAESTSDDPLKVARILEAIGKTYSKTQRPDQALETFHRALAIYEKSSVYGGIVETLSAMGEHFERTNDWVRAVEVYGRSATLASERRNLRREKYAERGKTANERSDKRSLQLITAAHMAAKRDDSLEPTLAKQTFESAQSVFSSIVTDSITQMASRGPDNKLASLIRRRQDLGMEWLKWDELRTRALTSATEKRDASTEAANLERLEKIQAEIAEIDRTAKAEFPKFTASARPLPLSVIDVQSVLHRDEVLLFFLDTGGVGPGPGGQTFLWAVSKTDVKWVRFEGDIGHDTLDLLRCGLDPASWDDDRPKYEHVYDMRFHFPCKGFTRHDPQLDARGEIRNETLPYDLNKAHELYRKLFEGVEELIRDKQLLIAATGRLSTLSFQALVTAPPPERKAKNLEEVFNPPPPGPDDYRKVAWLVRKHAITVLPSVSALRALRQTTKKSSARKPLVAIGNPLLHGAAADSRESKLARSKQACPITARNVRGGRSARNADPIKTLDGRPDLQQLLRQPPLHDTADEICAVAAALGAARNEILLGAKATEKNLRKSDLSQYRVLHFATHGTMAGEIDGIAEPGLILTPPTSQTNDDDGFLAASEIAALKLDADWVILSACNTAAAAGNGQEAMSGLARSFFYAGARSILASQWAVNSAASVKLITGAVQIAKRSANLGRAKALQRSMLNLIDKGASHESHPYYWAPFILVGEGAVALNG
jgi:CHAT domain-containing protein/tetratricopeptide (TPR) repeat protein